MKAHPRQRATSWRRIAVLFLLAPAFWVVTTADAAPPAINSRCPVMTEEDVDPKITVSYEGRTVAFCCDRCRAKFKADPAKYADRLPLSADATRPGESLALAGEGHGPSEAAHHETNAGAAAVSNGPEDDGHDHGGSGGESEDEPGPLLGRLHPAIVHFPVAGIPLALLGFMIWMLTGRDAFAKADVPPLVIGTLASVVAVITGNIAHDSMQFSPSMHRIVEQHQIVSTTVMGVALFLLALRVWRWETLTGRWRWGYGGGLLLTSALLGLTGYLGGSLVFGPDHLAW